MKNEGVTAKLGLIRGLARLLCLTAVCALSAGYVRAQVPARIAADKINSNVQSVIPGSKHPLAQASLDAGRVPADTQLHGMSIVFNRSAAQEAALQALLKAQQTPGSPQYHQWLTPAQFGARFGMAEADIQATESWLESQGFSIDSVSNSRTLIRFSGRVSQVEQAFSTQMHYYNVEGVKHFAPSTALSVPTALAPVIMNVGNLNDFRPKPMHVRSNPVARPQYTLSCTGISTGCTELAFLTPGDVKIAYDINPLITASNTGAGQVIAIMGQSAIATSDIENFQNADSLPVKDPTLTLVPGTGASTAQNNGDQGESDLDIEYSGGIATGATINFVYTGATQTFGVFDSYQYAVDNKIGNIISISYGTCEPAMEQSTFSTLEQIGSQAASQGQTVLAASGDSGATACYGYATTGNGAITTSQESNVAVNYPASSAYVTGVGGTEMSSADAAGTNTTYWAAAGSSGYTLTSLLSYVPEVVWNDDSINIQGGCTPVNFNCLSATGGGESIFAAQPSWQTSYFTATGESNPDSSARLVPDVAFYGSPNNPGYLYCTSDQGDWNTDSQGNIVQTASCANGAFYTTNGNNINIAGGTSFATPIFAGMVAILNQATNQTSGQGLINNELYTLAANSTTYASAFNDITSGNNGCTGSSADCPSTSGTNGYSAGTGYDMTTGLGSVNLDSLVTAWPASTTTAVSTTTQITGSTSPTVGTSASYTIVVAAASGTAVPTGTVTVMIDNTAVSGSPFTLTTGSASSSASFSYTFTTAGAHTITANYAGVTNSFAASTGTLTVNASGGTTGSGSFTLGFSPTTLTVSDGSQGTVTLTVTPKNYTGTVNLQYATSPANSNLCMIGGSAFTSNGSLVVTSATSAVSGTITVDTNGNDCTNADAVAALAKRGLHVIPYAGQKVAANRQNSSPIKPVPAGIAFAGLLLAGFLGRKSRWLRGLAAVLLVASIGLAISACGSSSSTPEPPKGNYTVTFTGQDSSTSTITAQGSFTLTVD